MTLTTVFEKETCGRCGGSGRYSYNQMHGSVCYGCNGNGERLTKRGAAASRFYVESCEIAYGEVVVGDTIRFSSVTMGGTPFSFKARVETIEPYEQKYKSGPAASDPDAPWQVAQLLMLNTTRRGQNYGLSGSPDSRVRRYWPEEVNAAKIADALAFQATLNKLGKRSKRVSA
jgi:hypothetical protein